MVDLAIEKYYKNHNVVGIDEAGRGALAGPVVAACVYIPPNIVLHNINDSKKISAKKREDCFKQITEQCLYGVGIIDVDDIEQLNIWGATKKAMFIACEQVNIPNKFALIDGNLPVPLSCDSIPIIGGDSKSMSIAAASIIAKVTRDRIMHEYAKEFPQYGFLNHVGYGTKKHKDAIIQYGTCKIHRKSFKGVIYT
jgi:ribonuclease HII